MIFSKIFLLFAITAILLIVVFWAIYDNHKTKSKVDDIDGKLDNHIIETRSQKEATINEIVRRIDNHNFRNADLVANKVSDVLEIILDKKGYKLIKKK